MGKVTQHPAIAGSPQIRAPCPISESHDCSQFDCGKQELNEWLRNSALQSNGRTARTYVVCLGTRVIGYYCLAAGAVLRKELPSAKMRQNTPQHVPVIVVGRLVVDREYQHQRIGSGMLKEAIFKSIEASRTIGVRVVLVHAIDDEAAIFYRGYDFVPSPIADRTLMLPIETAIRALMSKC